LAEKAALEQTIAQRDTKISEVLELLRMSEMAKARLEKIAETNLAEKAALEQTIAQQDNEIADVHRKLKNTEEAKAVL